MIETLAVCDPAHGSLLDRFYSDLYLPAFDHQREPLAAWTGQLWGDAPAPYRLSIVLAGTDLADPGRARLDGGIVSEWYPASRCGLLTYLVVAPSARRRGLGRVLLDGARAALADHGAVAAIFGEVSRADTAEARDRLARFRRWGARVVDVAYVQPRLGAGLARDRDLQLVAFFDGPPPPSLPGPIVAGFLRDFFRTTERAELDDELRRVVDGVPAEAALR